MGTHHNAEQLTAKPFPELTMPERELLDKAWSTALSRLAEPAG
jgi:hypothetical protein